MCICLTGERTCQCEDRPGTSYSHTKLQTLQSGSYLVNMTFAHIQTTHCSLVNDYFAQLGDQHKVCQINETSAEGILEGSL